MICLHCNKDFVSKRGTAKYCSTTCRVYSNQTKVALSPDLKKDEDTLVEARQVMDEMNKALAARGLPLLVMGSDLPPVEFISSGVKEIDEMTGGFPRRKVTEIYGPKGVGKTSLMSRIVNELGDLRVFYVDAEGGLPVPPDNVQVSTEHVLETIEDMVEEALIRNKYDLIVVDSIASIIPQAEAEGTAGESHMGLKARLMSQWMRKINIHLSKSDSALVFINQQRDTLSPYGPSKITPGGFAVPYAASLRLELVSNKADKLENGQWVHVTVEKSRVCKPYQKTKFKLQYSK